MRDFYFIGISFNEDNKPTLDTMAGCVRNDRI
jgi:hypothetical protein